ncbi:hypothetical protein D3C80_1608140 [compost metagenome]
MALFQHGKTIVNGMRGRQATAFETDAAQIGIGLDNALDRLGHHAGLDRQLGLHALCQQRLITQPRQAQCRQRGLAARHAGRLGIETGLCFKIG